jgi:hypothetical protein
MRVRARQMDKLSRARDRSVLHLLRGVFQSAVRLWGRKECLLRTYEMGSAFLGLRNDMMVTIGLGRWGLRCTSLLFMMMA